METTVTVKEVAETKNGWREVTFDDGLTASTKSQAVAEAANASKGNPVPAVINEVVNGNFTNRYLNEINGVSDGGGPARGKGGSTPAKRGGGGKSPEEQNRIARQHAVGQTTQLLAASGQEFSLPLDAQLQAAFDEQVERIYALTSKK